MAGRSARRSPLLVSLEQRLDVLTQTLDTADIAEKSIDIVKEIKELHAILRSLRDGEAPEGRRKIVVVWGSAPTVASGSARRAAGPGEAPTPDCAGLAVGKAGGRKQAS